MRSVIEIWELLLEMFDLGGVALGDVGIFGMMGGVVLVIVFGAVEGLQGDDLCDDAVAEEFGVVKLFDVGLSDAALIVSVKENDGTVLRSGVRALAIELRRIVRNREENFQQSAVSDFGGVIVDFNGLSVASFAGAYLLVAGIFCCAAGIARGDVVVVDGNYGIRISEVLSPGASTSRERYSRIQRG